MRVQAQTPLPTPIVCHGCPDRATYRFLEEIPWDSLQSHWAAKFANLFGNFLDVLGFNPNKTTLDPSHTHMECGKPWHVAATGSTNYARYGEYNGPMHFDCQVVLRDFAGVFGIYAATHDHSTTGQRWYNVVWLDTGTAEPPVMRGDKSAPMGVQTFKFHFDMDPRLNFHGFDDVNILGHAVFDNGDSYENDNLFSYFNNVDPTAPITVLSQGPADLPVWGVQVAPHVNPLFDAGDAFGLNIALVKNYLPTAPLIGAWKLPPNREELTQEDPLTKDAQGHGTIFTFGPIAFTNSYGQTVPSTPGSCQTRRDQNFHMEDLSNIGADGLPVMKGIYGTETARVDLSNGINCQVVIDNTGQAVGDHTYAISRTQPENKVVTNAVASLIVIHVPVPDGTVVINPPPPPPPPPPPVPTIVSVTTCLNVTLSDGSVTSECLHKP